ncbi:hypothetical protein AYO20_06482 [Fonsecaea nubica]|uniref:PSI domain-containing protein n=1 Tax=Fonsecaea nubica TaxID=856822 RepID=A0A178CXU0_9EURO|nr:hypothetical protein AYO20_06482 [Fonsecaea nubica]OAL34227.1 hypothetical protein AYO20_06482 [Fonsecaea nubica]
MTHPDLANTQNLPPHIASLLNTVNNNTSTIPGDNDLDLFFHCWIRPHCPACLSASNPYPCSWCATSQTCVPNTVYPYPFGILSPLKTADLCPLGWRERWELRARPFSCRCSSMTFVSVVVAVLATLLGLCLIWAGVRVGSVTVTTPTNLAASRPETFRYLADTVLDGEPAFSHDKSAGADKERLFQSLVPHRSSLKRHLYDFFPPSTNPRGMPKVSIKAAPHASTQHRTGQ